MEVLSVDVMEIESGGWMGARWGALSAAGMVSLAESRMDVLQVTSRESEKAHA